MLLHCYTIVFGNNTNNNVMINKEGYKLNDCDIRVDVVACIGLPLTEIH